LSGKFLTDLTHPDDAKVDWNLFRALVEGKRDHYQIEKRYYRKEGALVWGHLNVSIVRGAGGEPLFAISMVENITERKRAEETIQHLAYYDVVTNLPNRTLFNDRLSLALTYARHNQRKLAVMFLDLDRFKTINETLGHAIGDRLLRAVAERLGSCLREGDTIARLGGDEFMLLLPETSYADDEAKIAQKILEVFKLAFHLEGHELHITPSIGIALYPNDGEDAETLLKKADTALHRAKTQGGNSYQFNTITMNAKALERLVLENGLRRSLEREEMVVYYQPQVSLHSGQVVGMEALLRWKHPDRGLMPPMKFIPLAEETDLIVSIGEWVLYSACVQAKTWQMGGFPPLRVAVNISARLFRQHSLLETVRRALRETRLDPDCLELELTEGTLMENAEITIKTLHELKTMGTHLSVDDFGTGYSSLSYLKRFPIDTLKIDQSFVRDITTDPDDAAIARLIIAMAHSLKLKVIAEGVETEEQLAFLQTQECDEMQGYLFSKPLPVEAFTQLLQERRCLMIRRNA
ncbi:MAG: EAL domain-containing protein, partial [Nitrospira sp.]|nr:EAL domain-containing protein [Nitrospira sp.]